MSGSGKEYAIALYELAREGNVVSEVGDGLHFISKTIDLTPEYRTFLEAPGIPLEDRLNSIDEAFKGEVADLVVSFLGVLTSHGAINRLEDCIKEYDILFNLAAKRSVAYVTSAVELTDKEKAKLKDKLIKISGNEIEMRYRVDPQLLGGVIVDMDGTSFDGSIRRRLKNMKEVMS